jgi:transcriptional regulator with XRE-family HTH domain
MSSNQPPVPRYAIVISKRVRQAAAVRYPMAENKSQITRLLNQDSGVGKTTIQRILDPSTYGANAPGVDKLEAIAKALRVETYWLLMDPDKSQAPE